MKEMLIGIFFAMMTIAVSQCVVADKSFEGNAILLENNASCIENNAFAIDWMREQEKTILALTSALEECQAKH